MGRSLLIGCVAGWLSIAPLSIVCAAPTTIEAIGEEAGRDVLVTGLSADGKVVVGYTQISAQNSVGEYRQRAFRWSVDEGYRAALTPGSLDAVAMGCSADGRVVVGRRSSNTYRLQDGMVWTANGLNLNVRSGGTYFQTIDSCSADGSVLFGIVSSDDLTVSGAARWKSGAIELLDPNFSRNWGLRCSADGRLTVGHAYTGNSGFAMPAIWVEGSGTIELPTFPGAVSGSAYGCSPDGSTVIGNVSSDQSVAFDWTATRGMRRLPSLPGVRPAEQSATAWACSADGSMVVGEITASYWNPRGACVWIDGKTPRLLYDILERDYNLDMEKLGWSELLGAWDCTADGKVIAGYGHRSDEVGARNTVGFRVVLGERAPDPPRPPKARAGKNLVVTTTSERGLRVRLDGTRSSNPDGGRLGYRWKASRIAFQPNTAPKPLAMFPVGSTNVTLTVTNAARLSDADVVNVKVRLKNSRRRPRGGQANEAFARSMTQFPEASKASAISSTGFRARLDAAVADRLGVELGEFVRWEEGQSPDFAHAEYALLRATQVRYGQQAAIGYLGAYLEFDDVADLDRAVTCATGVLYAIHDATSP